MGEFDVIRQQPVHEPPTDEFKKQLTKVELNYLKYNRTKTN